MRILGIDIGTSAVKAAVLDAATGELVGPLAKAEYDIDFPVEGAAEVRPEAMWDALADAVHKAVAEQTVEAIGLSALTPGLVLLDRADRPLGPFWIHLDRRAREQSRRIHGEVGDEFLKDTGCRPLPGGMSAVCWQCRREHEPELPGLVHRYLQPNAWIALKMTGTAAVDPGCASFTGLYNTMGDGAWSPRWCEYFGVDPAWLPAIIDGRETVGTLRANTAHELGLPAGIPVKLGTADTSSAMLAARLQPGELLHTVGTTQVLAAFADPPAPDARRLTRRFGVGDSFVHVTHNPVGGVALDWLYDLCFRDVTKDDFYTKHVPAALDRPTRVTLDPPYLGGDRLLIERGQAAFCGLALGVDRLDLLAAVLNAMREHHREAIANLGATRPFTRIVLTGGGANLVRELIPEYADARVDFIDEGAVRGTAQLFAETG